MSFISTNWSLVDYQAFHQNSLLSGDKELLSILTCSGRLLTLMLLIIPSAMLANLLSGIHWGTVWSREFSFLRITSDITPHILTGNARRACSADVPWKNKTNRILANNCRTFQSEDRIEPSWSLGKISQIRLYMGLPPPDHPKVAGTDTQDNRECEERESGSFLYFCSHKIIFHLWPMTTHTYRFCNSRLVPELPENRASRTYVYLGGLLCVAKIGLRMLQFLQQTQSFHSPFGL